MQAAPFMMISDEKQCMQVCYKRALTVAVLRASGRGGQPGRNKEPHFFYCSTAKSHIIHVDVTPSLPHTRTYLCSARSIVNVTRQHVNDKDHRPVVFNNEHCVHCLTQTNSQFNQVHKKNNDFQNAFYLVGFLAFLAFNNPVQVWLVFCCHSKQIFHMGVRTD